MKFRKKPVVIEAFKYDGKNYDNLPQWAKDAIEKGVIYFEGNRLSEGPYIRTLEGVHHVSLGDYIIQGVKGELYPCKPDIFEATYEPVLEATE